MSLSNAELRFSDADRAQLSARGVTSAEAARQLTLLAHPPGFAQLVRPCTLGDGVLELAAEDLPALESAARTAAAAGRVQAFVPASGAATRMFKDLLAALAGPEPWSPAQTLAAAAEGRAEARALQALVEGLERFAFHDALAAGLAPCGTLLAELEIGRAHV